MSRKYGSHRWIFLIAGLQKYIGFKNGLHVRDVWRQKNLSDLRNIEMEKLSMAIPAHGVQLYKLTPVENQ